MSASEEGKKPEKKGNRLSGMFGGALKKKTNEVKKKINKQRKTEILGDTIGVDVPFSLRNFLCSLILQSNATLSNKLEIMFNLFDWDDGESDGLDSFAIKSMVKTIYERNLFYVPGNECDNMVELAFD